MDQLPPDAQDQGEGQSPEDQIVDQIGELMAQLSPEKQQAVIEKLSAMVGEPAEQPGQELVSPEGGPNGKPMGY